MSGNIIEDETGRPIRKVNDELNEGDYILTQSPAVINEDGFQSVKISVERIRDIDGDYVYLSNSGKVPKFRITHVVRGSKPVNYSGCDRMRMIQEDDKALKR